LKNVDAVQKYKMLRGSVERISRESSPIRKEAVPIDVFTAPGIDVRLEGLVGASGGMAAGYGTRFDMSFDLIRSPRKKPRTPTRKSIWAAPKPDDAAKFNTEKLRFLEGLSESLLPRSHPVKLR
jgi:hypothetical protein